ncbi:phosphatidylglycerophosphate phosphatase 1, chloroplastic/mitochondrial isoform X2 [Euphorbia lathyris]|uniref:phosphatidylglycerophosphate phosphatase 1, chloroplastic/mitochondrial isoform X2 n=1 Tax=Euphorbia lathyris TaxID=212925 RepID=UPI003313CE08
MSCPFYASLPNCNCPIPTPLNLPPNFSRRRTKSTSFSFSTYQTCSRTISSLTLHPTIICNYRAQDHLYICYSDPTPNHTFPNQFQSSPDTNSVIGENPETQFEQIQEEEHDKPTGLFTNMWWVDIKAALGQRINIEGIRCSVSVFVKEQHLALPHVSVRDVRYIDWTELHRRGFKGVVFDKDNTITVPYSLKLWGPLASSMEHCKSVFGNNVAVFSNSAGLCEYDHDFSKARALEKAIGIKVISHRVKKPAGTAEEIENYFGCTASQLIMIGDRPFTDVVYGNRNGFFTILTEPLSLSEEPFIVRQVRKLEMAFTNHWLGKGKRPVSHNLLPDATQCIKDPI